MGRQVEPSGCVEQSLFGDTLRHLSTAVASSTFDCGENAVRVFVCRLCSQSSMARGPLWILASQLARARVCVIFGGGGGGGVVVIGVCVWMLYACGALVV